MKGKFGLIMMIIMMIIMIMITMMILILTMMRIVLQDMSAWTLEPALMSAMKKTPGPSVNVRSGIIDLKIKRRFVLSFGYLEDSVFRCASIY